MPIVLNYDQPTSPFDEITRLSAANEEGLMHVEDWGVIAYAYFFDRETYDGGKKFQDFLNKANSLYGPVEQRLTQLRQEAEPRLLELYRLGNEKADKLMADAQAKLRKILLRCQFSMPQIVVKAALETLEEAGPADEGVNRGLMLRWSGFLADEAFDNIEHQIDLSWAACEEDRNTIYQQQQREVSELELEVLQDEQAIERGIRQDADYLYLLQVYNAQMQQVVLDLQIGAITTAEPSPLPEVPPSTSTLARLSTWFRNLF